MKIEKLNYTILQFCLLKALNENNLELGPLFKILEFNHFETPLPTVKICLKDLLNKNYVYNKDSLYKISESGKQYLSNLHSTLTIFFNNVFNSNFNNPQLQNYSVIKDNEFNQTFNNLSCLKFIPYSSHNFPNDDDDLFFTNTIFTRGELFYQFVGKRGLGEHNYKNTLALFFNSGSISYLGVIKQYDHSIKKISFKEGSVLKLKTPIFEKDIKQIIPTFKFIRNFITFDNSKDITNILSLIKSHLEVIQDSDTL